MTLDSSEIIIDQLIAALRSVSTSPRCWCEAWRQHSIIDGVPPLGHSSPCMQANNAIAIAHAFREKQIQEQQEETI